MLAFSRKQVLQPKVLNVDAAVANLIKMLGRLITSNIEIVTRQAEEAWYVKVDPGQLDQVILNLALNARDAMPLGGQVVIETRIAASLVGKSISTPKLPPEITSRSP
jgi:signal transduction histidine kinase